MGWSQCISQAGPCLQAPGLILLPRTLTWLNSVLAALGLGTLFPYWLSIRGCVQPLKASLIPWFIAPPHLQSQQQPPTLSCRISLTSPFATHWRKLCF